MREARSAGSNPPLSCIARFWDTSPVSRQHVKLDYVGD
jgi:hypothetical protein